MEPDIPHDLKAEKAILGAILINNDALVKVLGVLSKHDFFIGKHIYIFAAMSHLYSKDEPIDLITLSQTLKEQNVLDRAGGIDYLTSLAENTTTSAEILKDAEIIKDLSIRRDIISKDTLCPHI